MKTGWRKFTLTAHVTSSVGWLGAIVAFLGIAVVALMDSDDSKVRAASSAMQIVGWAVIVPFSVASLISGLVQSLGTTCGLFKHYWVITKLLITVGASGLLLLHMRVVDSIALAASNSAATMSHLLAPKTQVVADAAGALVVLLVATALSIYKPQGRTDETAPRWVRVVAIAIGAVLLAAIATHVSGGAKQSHFDH